MNVLQISVHDFGGAAYALAEAIKETTDHDSMSVRQSPGSYIKYKAHLVASEPDDLIGPWNWADVVHVHDICPKLAPGLLPKPTVVTYHGSMYRRKPKLYHDYVKSHRWIGTVATIDLTAHGFPWMPDCRPDLKRYVDRPRGRFVVAHAPTSRIVKDTEKVIEQLDIEGIILDVIERVPFEECLTRKGRASVYVDQFRLCYGLNAIEAWQMGMPAIANAKKETLGLLEELIGFIPFVKCTPDQLRAKVQKLKNDPKTYKEGADRGVECAEKFHAPAAAAAIAFRYYQEAMAISSPGLADVAGRSSRPGVYDEFPGASGMVKIRYVGGNYGYEEVTGPVTHKKYRFSAGDPVKYVDVRDSAGLLKMIRGTGAKKRHTRPEFVLMEE